MFIYLFIYFYKITVMFNSHTFISRCKLPKQVKTYVNRVSSYPLKPCE